MSLLSDTADAIYNGVSFELYASKILVKPVQDSAGRTTKYDEFEIRVERALVEPPEGKTTTDNNILYIIRQLSAQGGVLHWNQKGYGALYANAQGFRDVKFGPIVELVDIQPWGNGRSAFVTWNCKTWLPRCPDGDDVRNFQWKIMELVFSQEHKLDKNGYSSINISGHLEIPLNRTTPANATFDAGGNLLAVTPGASTIPDHVDNWRERALQTPVPYGFQRENFTFKTNLAKNAADFSWTDQQLREALPPYCTETTITHEIDTALPAACVYKNTLSGTIVPPPGISKDVSYRYLLSLVSDRWMFARQYVPLNNPPVPAPAPQPPGGGGGGPFGGALGGGAGILGGFGQLMGGGNAANPNPGGLGAGLAAGAAGNGAVNPVAIIPVHMRVGNEIGGRGLSFTFTYNVLRRYYLAEALLGQGMWRPFALTDWSIWKQTMDQSKVNDAHGPAGVFFRPQDDAIVDLCVASPKGFPGKTPSVSPVRQGMLQRSGKFAEVPQGMLQRSGKFAEVPQGMLNSAADKAAAGPGFIDSSAPPIEASWLMYFIDAVYEEPIGRYARHRPLQGTLTDNLPISAAGPGRALRQAVAGSPASALWDKADILQEVGAPTAVIRLYGAATRIGHRVPMPRLLAISGFNVKLNRVVRFNERAISRWGDMRIWRAEWEQEYFLDTPIKQPMPKFADPVLGLNGAYTDPTLQEGITQGGSRPTLGGNLLLNPIR